jgi:phospholipase/carboxylesterase
VAYSPGFLIAVPAKKRPPILITHGTSDSILPIEDTSRRMVPELRKAGYSVDFREFDGNHAVQQSVMDEVINALARPG